MKTRKPLTIALVCATVLFTILAGAIAFGDLAAFLKAASPPQPSTLVGFSAGGGFVLRVAGSSRQDLFQSYLLLSPLLSQDAPTFRPDSGGWVSVGVPRYIGIALLNLAGISAFNDLPVTAFALDEKAKSFLTPEYSFALASNFRPKRDYAADIRAVRHPCAVIAGVDLLGKPYTREALARKIRHVLANRKQRAQPVSELRNGFSAVAGAAAQPARLKILLVEDEETIRQNTAELLALFGHTVLLAASGEEAVDLLAAAGPDVLMIDISLPGMSGLALAQKARSLMPQLRVVFASGQAEAASVPGAVLLQKPYDGAALAAALNAAG